MYINDGMPVLLNTSLNVLRNDKSELGLAARSMQNDRQVNVRRNVQEIYCQTFLCWKMSLKVKSLRLVRLSADITCFGSSTQCPNFFNETVAFMMCNVPAGHSGKALNFVLKFQNFDRNFIFSVDSKYVLETCYSTIR